MKIAIAPDSFKGSMTALEVAQQIALGLKTSIPDVEVVKIPMADGGEGTVQAFIDATDGRFFTCKVRDPLGRQIEAQYGITGDGQTAIIEMAAANGISLLTKAELNPLKTSSYGTGELISHALDMDVSKILIGIGGSATNDGGMGMACALGARFLDENDNDLDASGENLKRIKSIDVSRFDDRLANVTVEVACDVDNPLTGENGASAIYGPQKGATPEMVAALDAGLLNYAIIVQRDCEISINGIAGAGAAGGLGGGLLAFLNATLRSGSAMIAEAVGLRDKIEGCDLVITGEGRLDAQTVHGKTPAGVAICAMDLEIPVIAIAGCLGDGVEAVRDVGICAWFSALSEIVSIEELPLRGPDMLRDCAEQVGRLLVLRD